MELRQPIEYGQRSTKPIAPVILPTATTLKEAETVNNGKDAKRLQIAIDSLGYPSTRVWGDALRLIGVVSLGQYPRISQWTKYLGITEQQAATQVAGLRNLFGSDPKMMQLVNLLLQEQFLSFDVIGDPPSAQKIEFARHTLDTILGHDANKELEQQDIAELYRILDCAPTPSAAVRRAYERQVLTPQGIPGARRFGFHLVQGWPLPNEYPRRSQPTSLERSVWAVTQAALRGQISHHSEYLPESQTTRLLTPACLAALGCSPEDIGLCIGLKPSTIQNYLYQISARNGVIERRNAMIHWLFTSGTFFATQQAIALAKESDNN